MGLIFSMFRLQERIKENCEKDGEDYTGFDDLDSLTDRFRGNLIIQEGRYGQLQIIIIRNRF